MFRTIMLYTLYEPFRDLFSQKLPLATACLYSCVFVNSLYRSFSCGLRGSDRLPLYCCCAAYFPLLYTAIMYFICFFVFVRYLNSSERKRKRERVMYLFAKSAAAAFDPSQRF